MPQLSGSFEKQAPGLEGLEPGPLDLDPNTHNILDVTCDHTLLPFIWTLSLSRLTAPEPQEAVTRETLGKRLTIIHKDSSVIALVRV